MACGLPVAGWRAGNLPNLAEHGVNGVVVEPGDIDGLADGLRRLATDEVWRRQLADAARRRAGDFPTWNETAAELFAALRRLVRRPVEPAQHRPIGLDVNPRHARILDIHPPRDRIGHIERPRDRRLDRTDMGDDDDCLDGRRVGEFDARFLHPPAEVDQRLADGD